MKIKTYGNETRVTFRKKKDSEYAVVSVTFPDRPNWYLFIYKNGEISWYNDKTDELVNVES